MDAAAGFCTARRRDGSACTARVLPSSTEQRCFAHDSARQDALRESRAAGGRGRRSTVRASKALPAYLQDAQEQLVRLLSAVEQGELPPRAAEVIGGLVGRLVDLARYGDERGSQRAIEERLTELERRFGAGDAAGRTWRAR